jgi:CRP/FNR family transcriptional regulator
MQKNLNKIHLKKELMGFIKEKYIPKKFKKGNILYDVNTICNKLSIVIDGKLEAIKYNSKGKEQLVVELKNGDIFGAPLIFSENTYPVYIIALEDTEVIEIPKQDITKILKNDEFLIFFLKEFGEKIIKMSEIIDYLLDNSVESRLISYLSKLKKSNTLEIDLDKSKNFIAKEIGTSREVVSRSFKILEEKGIIKIIDLKKIKILKEEYFK